MSRSLRSNRWISAHLYFDDSVYGATSDRVLLDIVETFAWFSRRQRWTSKYFFVRYADPRSHVRFRLKLRGSACEERVADALVGHVDEHSANLRRRDLDPIVAALEWSPYEPETARYGGENAMAIAEDHFCLSSRCAMALIKQSVALKGQTRGGLAAIAFLASICPFAVDRASIIEFTTAYAESYLASAVPDPILREGLVREFTTAIPRQRDELRSAIRSAYQTLLAGGSFSCALTEFAQGSHRIAARLARMCASGKIRAAHEHFNNFDAVWRWIVPSFIHMTNNRLGLGKIDECFVSLLVRDTLSSINA